ncbi:MAG: serine acetyltransferase [Sphingomonas bacterium]|uniref:serine O-acetyltransferase EpsC n=1 Tax=Sphingomonas bacterium TaxID=1895847 RepID=UPI00262F6772|nr:serine O-acetyltransferase EpsC [Sphingomonas bacterium]MDB5707809.1 serine acetyltransferase [Sphingomonas bacterium]
MNAIALRNPPTTLAPIEDVVLGLAAARRDWRAAHHRHAAAGTARFPSRVALEFTLEHLEAALFPQRLGHFEGTTEDVFVRLRLEQAFGLLAAEIGRELRYWEAETGDAFDADHGDTIVRLFADALPEIRRLIDRDVAAAFQGDPAARSVDEILICYPCAVAVMYHRLAHQLFELGAPLVARVISEIANTRTGIDIHPGATIGPSFFIDHGTGVVIGETAIIGARVRLYQHVTLGARRLPPEDGHSVRERVARHPIVEDDVVIYAGATILGRVTIGRGATVGGNVWVTEDVAPGALVMQPSALTFAAGEAPPLFPEG